MTRARSAFAASLAAALTLGGAAFAPAQDTPKDDALDRLLEKLEDKKPAPAGESAPKSKDDKVKAKDEKAKPKDDKGKADKSKPAEEPKDKALDSLLEKLGETKEAPKTTGPAGAQNPNIPAPDAGKPEDKSAGNLKPGEKPLDEHLEELTGRYKKKKQGQQQQQGGQQGQEGKEQDDGSDENTPIGRAVKKMRMVETKLGQDDTGDETRKTQGEIVKDLDQLIAQAKRQQQMQQKGKRRRERPGQPQDGQQQDQPGAQGDTARGAPPMKTMDAKLNASLAGDKNTWGNLPARLREEMDNVFKSEPLPAKAERIARYYESVKKKGMSSPGG